MQAFALNILVVLTLFNTNTISVIFITLFIKYLQFANNERKS